MDPAAGAQACSIPTQEQQIAGCFTLWTGRAQKCAAGEGAASSWVETGASSQQLAQLSALITSRHPVPWHPWDAPWLAAEEWGSTVLPLAGGGTSVSPTRDTFASIAVGAGCKGADGYSKAHPRVIPILTGAQGKSALGGSWLLIASWSHPRQTHSAAAAGSVEHGW